MPLPLPRPLVCLLVVLYCHCRAPFIAAAPPINVCLHAQVSPTEKIVGSVVTTDGMRSAFSARHDVSSVQIFYPFHYSTFTDTSWNLVLIEGWFPSIHTFIALARANNPDVVVLFYCLDPSYPGMPLVFALDVDGFLTNSQGLLEELRRRRPAMYVPLAADPELMRSDPTVPREYGAVYVGAGSSMLKVKPLLTEMLYRSLPYGLRLYGAHWEKDPRLEVAYQGVLPRGTLHQAYSSARAVLACTIASQRAMGMINNRIFEALSCGNVVISDYSDVLNETFGEVLQFVHQPEDVDVVLQQLMDPRFADHFQGIRDRGRELIVSRHTWSHRVLEILDLFTSLQSKSSLPVSVSDSLHRKRSSEVSANCFLCSPRMSAGGSRDSSRSDGDRSASSSTSSIPLLAWVVSDVLAAHMDYLMSVRPAIDNFFADKYLVHMYTESEWLALLQCAETSSYSADDCDKNGKCHSTGGGDSGSVEPPPLAVVSQYSIVLAVMNHLGSLHQGFIAFQQWHRDAHHDAAITVTPITTEACNSPNEERKHTLDRTQQKYVAFLLGIDEAHSRQTLRSYSSVGRDNRGVYLSELFDMVLFRDSFERQLVSDLEKESYAPMIKYFCGSDDVQYRNTMNNFQLRNSAFRNRTCDFPTATEHMNEFRWQICSGMWTSAPKATENMAGDTETGSAADVKSTSSAQKNIAICIWGQRLFCTARQRSRYISPSVNYTLLLFGGMLSGWTTSCDLTDSSSPSCVLDSIPLERVVHVRHGETGSIAERFLQATELFFIYDENIKAPALEKGNRDGSEDVNTNYGIIDSTPYDEAKNTIQDVIWPLLFGAVFQKSIRLSKQPGPHVSHLLTETAWNRQPLLLQWQKVMSVLLTFGSLKTSGEFVANYVNPPMRVEGEAEPLTLAADAAAFSHDHLLVFVHLHNFVPGLDGQVCFFLDGELSSFGCRYSRDHHLLELDLHLLSWSAADWERAEANSEFTHVTKTTTLRIELRGVLYLQYFYEMEQSYIFCLPNPFYDRSNASTEQAPPCVNGTENPHFDLSLQQQYRDSSGGLTMML